MKPKIFIHTLLGALALSSVATGQPGEFPGSPYPDPDPWAWCNPASCFQGEHQPPGCDCVMDDVQYFLEEYETNPVSSQTFKGAWYSQSACNCGYLPCGDLRVCEGAEHSFTKEDQVCWTVSGNATFSGKTGLLTRLLGELGVSVQIGLQMQHCHKFTEGTKFKVPMSNCFKNYAREVWVETEIQGTVREICGKFHWISYELVGGQTIEIDQGWTECNVKTASGRVTKVSEHEVQYPPYPERCGGAVPSPDPYDGKRAEPCCSPLPPCDPVPPGSHSCCVCYAST